MILTGGRGVTSVDAPLPDARRSALDLEILPDLRVWWENIRDSAIAFVRDNCPGMAGMVAFFGFLSGIPLLLLLLAFVGNVLGGVISPHEIRDLFQSVVPGLTQKEFLQTYWDPVRQSKVATTVLGVVSLLFGALGLNDSVDWALNRIWRSSKRRSFWVAKMRGLGVILWVTAFAVLSLGLTSLWALALDLARAPSGLATAVAALVPSTFLDICIFTALYRLTPTVRVRLQPALVGGAVGAVLWELSKVLFGWWVLQVGTYNRIYGPLTAVVIVMLWMWISAMIFLYGAALAFAAQCRMAGEQPAPESWWYDA
jgi:membrane protein